MSNKLEAMSKPYSQKTSEDEEVKSSDKLRVTRIEEALKDLIPQDEVRTTTAQELVEHAVSPEVVEKYGKYLFKPNWDIEKSIFFCLTVAKDKEVIPLTILEAIEAEGVDPTSLRELMLFVSVMRDKPDPREALRKILSEMQPLLKKIHEILSNAIGE